MHKKLVFLTMSVALLMSAAAQAQTTHMKVAVPFAFTAGNVSMPAGEYEVSALGPWGGTALTVYNVRSHLEAVVVSNSCRSQKAAADSKLIFHRYGQQYFLAEVWNRDSFAGSQIRISPRQTELAKKQPMNNVVLMASRK